MFNIYHLSCLLHILFILDNNKARFETPEQARQVRYNCNVIILLVIMNIFLISLVMI
jgi:hypothetical protein